MPQSAESEVASADQPYKTRRLAAHKIRQVQPVSGRRTRAVGTQHGAYIRSAIPARPVRNMHEIALDATLRSAALNGAGLPLKVTSQDYRVKVRTARSRNLILFAVDASGSMAARKRMEAVKGAILSLLLDAYQKRDQVGLVTFRGETAQVALPPTNSVSVARRHLEKLPTGGRTPLSAGLITTYDLLQKYQQRDDSVTPLIVVLSDGRANVARKGSKALVEVKTIAQKIAAKHWSTLVIDCESGYRRLGLAKTLATDINGQYLQLEELSADQLTREIRTSLMTHSALLPQ